MGAVGALLALVGLALEASFLLSGLAAAWAGPLGTSARTALGQLAGDPILGWSGGACFLVGVLLLARKRRPEEGYAGREVLQVLSGASGAALTVVLLVGKARGWGFATLGALALSAAAESLLAATLTLRLALDPTRRWSLFLPGALGGGALGLLHLVLLTLCLL